MAAKAAKKAKKEVKKTAAKGSVRRSVSAKSKTKVEDKIARKVVARPTAAKPAVRVKPATKRRYPSEDDLERMVEEATLDAYDGRQQAAGFLRMLGRELAIPFATVVLGVPVTVERLDLAADNRIIAVCRRDQASQNLQLLDLPLPEPHPKGWEWIAAYRYWVR